MKKKYLLGLTLVLLIACRDDAISKNINRTTIQNDWILVEIDNHRLTQDNGKIIPNIAIDADLKVSGFSGCNRFMGLAEITKQKFRIKKWHQTKMQCLNKTQTQLETLVKNLLSQWSEASISDHQLILKIKKHRLIFLAEPQFEQQYKK